MSSTNVPYAIVRDGGRQYCVQIGQELDLDLRLLSRGSTFELKPVLAYRDETGLTVGHPDLPNISVKAEVLGIRQGPKIIVQKFRRRKNYRRKKGHRQLYTRVRIVHIGTAEPSLASNTAE